ncbi:hypothetical protein [Natrinema sp. 1APR25-10V2]|uniref:DUF7288 family protein n=1 Tax=Natrinema sp. 1APR25-10V2 TaxID=2951081 RepID=UPI002874AF46|nr:hypothetical protein [Natrinema sp. 1APR25-10V2]MDS0474135.1 hypothetical protein [Natrinema sp. 1APR25-10V2]
MYGPDTTPKDDDDRGQAYTLEGFIGAMVVLMAVLFALQSVVITPTTGGLADRTAQLQIQQEVQDSLVVSSQDGNLSEIVRNWAGGGGFEDTSQPPAPDESNETYSVDQFANESDLGQILKERFGENGWTYNVELYAEGGEERTLVYQGSPPASALTASYTVTLYDNQTVTSDTSSDKLHETNGSERMIPREYGDDTPLYNVVEVRVIIW